MFEPPDYLRIGKPTGLCATCGKSLAEDDRLASVLIPADEPQPGGSPGEPQAEDAGPARVERSDAAPPAGSPSSSAPAEQAEERPAFLRRDFCTACWDEMKEQAYFSFWIGKRSMADQPARKLNRAERNVALAALFDSLAERTEEGPGVAPHLFFLAHLLMKFKVFRWLPAGPHPQTGEPMLRFAKVQSGEEVFVPEMEMSDEAVARIKEEVEAYLEQATGQAVRI